MSCVAIEDSRENSSSASKDGVGDWKGDLAFDGCSWWSGTDVKPASEP